MNRAENVRRGVSFVEAGSVEGWILVRMRGRDPWRAIFREGGVCQVGKLWSEQFGGTRK